jgi:hypothetical protein
MHTVSLTGACGVIDTECTIKFSNNFEKWKSYAKRRRYAKKLKMHAVSLTPHAKYDTACTIDDWFERPWQPLKGISTKNIYVPEYPTTKKYLNLKGLPNTKFSCMRCHWHRMHDFCVRKSIISRRIRSRIQKDFIPWIRGQGGIVLCKNRGSTSHDSVPFRQNRFALLNYGILYKGIQK